jgi:subtilase family serine protease
MRRLIPAFILLIGIAMSASTASAQAVQLSGRTYHKEACVGPSAPGTARCHAHLVTDRAGNILHDLGRGGRPLAVSNTTPAGYGPSAFQSAYNLPSFSPPAPGTSVTIAIVDAYGYPNAEKDLGVYRAQYGLGACTTANGCFKKVNQNGGTSYPKNNTGWAQEQSLDLDMVSAICPNCKILLVEATTSSYANLATAENYAANYPGVHAVSNSYGGSEAQSSSYDASYNHPGVAITVSTGDSGYGVQFPASSEWVTAVGGTTLSKISGGRGWSETAWSGGGSGCSGMYQKPGWQHDTLCSYRMEADTSAVADPNTPVAAYGPIFGNFSGWLEFGGTSVAAPLTAGIYGLKNDPVNYGQNPYVSANPYTTNWLWDVTSGSNGSCSTPTLTTTYFCTAGTGYDGPTGLGTPNGTAAF